ncbi:hypothetical protein Nepgr_022333 [Nepenthes gracilis]|uniref:Uncharacterized protein n=1 Tax=Nepenthes gracilis TaxID=150966 RepID=A0AAD3T1R8_NEPGR|nr:hypothetical protein Nepgr_022333 [Nepenthes gracilis]
MAPSRKKGGSKAAAEATVRRQWKAGDLVLAKVKGFPAWPATVSEPEKWGYSPDWRKVLVYFFGTDQIAFCNPADVEAFTEEKKQSLLVKRHGKSSDFIRAVREIVDCYDKLKEQNQVHELGPHNPVESTAVGNSDLKNAAISPRTLKSSLNPSNTATENNESSSAVEDPAVSRKVVTCQETGAPNDRADDFSVLDVTLPRTCIRKKSGRMQTQRFVTQTTLAIRRSRSSVKLNSCMIQNDMMPSNDSSNGVGNEVTTASGDGFVSSSKQNMESPDEYIFVEQSPVCNSIGTLEDNCHETNLPESDNIHNNEGRAMDNNYKLGRSEVPIECCEDLELSKRLDLEIKTVILRKKRKPGRKRVAIDVVESVAIPDQEVNLDTLVDASYHNSHNGGNPTERFSKDDGDEHLPLAKRARVRMGKPLFAEEKPDILIKSEVKSSVAISDNVIGQISTSLDCEDENLQGKNAINGKGSLPCDLLSDSCTQASEDRSQLLKPGRAQPISFSLDGEAALPPSKRLNRALEAMSVNVAEECQACAETSSSLKTCTNECQATSRISHAIMEQKAENLLEMQNESFNCDDASQDDSSGLSTSSNPSISEGATKSSDDANVSISSVRSLDSMKDHSGKVARTSESVLEDDNEVHLGVSSNPAVEDREASTDKSEDCTAIALCSRGDKFGQTAEILNPVIDVVENCRPVKSLMPQIHDSNKVTDLFEAVKNFRAEIKMRAAPSSILLRATTTENISRLGSVADEKLLDKDVASSPSPADVDVSHTSLPMSVLAMSNNTRIEQYNNGCASDSVLRHEKYASDLDNKKCLDSGVANRGKSLGNQAEVRAALASLEIRLATLTRTKESIAQATRIAIECGKIGVAAEAIDILAHNLERESSLYRRVDLFFLVDSIAQCARLLKGGAGDVYISAIQATLPRLLAAAAPSGYAARENRRQCRKVLKLWLERRILPESVIRQHVRDLDYLSCSSSTGAYSRRMSRTERSFDDPLLEMEGMLVDEYGSNSSIQLPGFCMPGMLKVQDDESDSDVEIFEAVTPEHETDNPEKCEATAVPTTEKHRHILEAVDGELEMEDVAPSSDVDIRPDTNTTGVNSAHCSQPFGQEFPSYFAPPLPHDLPTPAPPLPMSPPPLLPPPPPPLIPPPSSVPHDVVGLQLHIGRHNMKDTMPSQQPASGITPQIQITDLTSSSSLGSYPVVHPPMQPGNNLQEADATLYGNAYHLRPPFPTSSNQFSYFQADQQQVDQQREASTSAPSFCDRSQIAKLPQHELAESWKFYRPSFPGPPHSEKAKTYTPPHYGLFCEATRTPNHGWGFPPLPMHHRNHTPSGPFSGGAVPVAIRAPSYWRPR